MARLAAALLAAVILALLNLANLAGAGYANLANHRLDQPESPGTLAAAQIAARWTPWSSPRQALYGWLLAENRRGDESEAAYRKALRLAPADALLWAEYAQALARLGRFDAALTGAVTQARQLAPNSPAVQHSLAELGLSYWQRGTGEQQALWLASMRDELARSRGAFLGHALTRGQGQTFCRGPARPLGEEKWCESIASALLGGCFQLTSIEPVPCNPSP